ncbi:hypothetical protein DL96DRAFT_1576408 [Flagelloscypha sp. PMI_526]|nr:hypothetical protein DL96DRAFT_1576408 [Flagelloscypha sp. PMI_526]
MAKPEAIALVLLPPPHIRALIDPVRSGNDKSWQRNWTAHITVLFPFDIHFDLNAVIESLQTALWSTDDIQPFKISLNKVSRFATRDYETVYFALDKNDKVASLWSLCARTLDHPIDAERGFIPHMTLGQTARNSDSISFLTVKGERILAKNNINWDADSVALLRRNDDKGGIMELVAHIPFNKDIPSSSVSYGLWDAPTYRFDGQVWTPTALSQASASTFTIGSYNLLHDAAFPLSHRLPSLLHAVTNSGTDILCLQEVSDEHLDSLLSDTHLRELYPWCSRYVETVMESERNVVILARKDFAFQWDRLELGTPHKSAAVARLQTAEGSIVIAAVHLSAGRTGPVLEKKAAELSVALSHLQTHYPNDDWIVIGDMNWPDSEPFPCQEELEDIWDLEGGQTFDPTTNSIAAATIREGQDPQRYDRILVKRSGRLHAVPNGLQLFGLPSAGQGPASDHWGVSAALKLGVAAPIASTFVPSEALLETIATSITDEELRQACTDHNCVPTPDQNAAFAQAVVSLRAFIASLSSSATNDAVKFIAEPVGSYAMGYHTPDSDIDCVVVGNVSPASFWDLVRVKIRRAGPDSSVKLRRFVKDASVQMMELSVDEIKMDIQYCPAGRLIESWSTLLSIPRDSPAFTLPVSTLKTLNAYRDALALKSTLPSLETFRLAHRSVKLFLKLNGLIGARFGYLGGFHIAFLLARVTLLLPPTVTASELVRTFFHTYARWDWDAEMVTVPIPGVGPSTYRRNKLKEPMCILSIEKPSVNMTINASIHSRGALKEGFKLSDELMEKGASWSEVLQRGGLNPLNEFLTTYKSFIKMDVSYWSDDCMKGRALVGWLESRLVKLLVNLNATNPSLQARFWPTRLTSENADDVDGHFNGFYLFGLRSSPLPTTLSSADADLAKKKVLDSLITSLRTFETDIHSNAVYYDPAVSYVWIGQVGQSKLPPKIVPHNHEWADKGFDDEFLGDDDELDDIDDIIPGASGADSSSLSPETTTASPSTGEKNPKLRTSIDVLNRLLWDPDIKSSDFVVGYEDRFRGVMEMPITSWKREIEDEAFIPLHRIVYFRRKSDDVRVWDRKTRKDLLFGSGAGSI